MNDNEILLALVWMLGIFTLILLVVLAFTGYLGKRKKSRELENFILARDFIDHRKTLKTFEYTVKSGKEKDNAWR